MLEYAERKDKIPGSFSYCLQRSDLDDAVGNSSIPRINVSFVRFYIPPLNGGLISFALRDMVRRRPTPRYDPALPG